MKDFLDANVLFSASLPASRMAELIKTLNKHKVCVTSAYALEEARRNHNRKMPDTLPGFEALFLQIPLVSETTDFRFEGLKAKDWPILGAAIAGQCTHLLTGDAQDFGRFFGKTFDGVRVVTAKMLTLQLVNVGWAKAGQ